MTDEGHRAMLTGHLGTRCTGAPSRRENDAAMVTDLDATGMIWEFLEQHPIPE